MLQQQQSNFEQYKRVKLLGEGAFGKAYLVQCHSDSSFCVIKQVDFARMSAKEKKETYKEAQILEVLSHPNIIRFKEVYTTKKGKLCIVMDYADGDFGIARILGSTIDKARTQVGTPYYLSPEIVENRPYSFKSDIWSLGVILYELCALHPPFNSDNLPGLALKIARGNYEPISVIYSRELRKLVEALLLLDARRRPSTKDILKMPFIQKRIKNFLSETDQNNEFSHTILHQKNVLTKNRKLMPMREDEFGKPIQQNNNGNYVNINNILQQHYNNNQQQINPIPQQILIQKPVKDIPNRDEQILLKQQQQFQEKKKRQQQSLEKNNENKNFKQTPKNNNENIHNNNNNNQQKYKKNIREGISTPKNQKPIKQNFFPIQTPSNGNWQPQFQRNNSSKNEGEQKINFPVNNNYQKEKKILFPPSLQQYSSNQENNQERKRQQQDINQKINEKNKKFEELKQNNQNSPETKWRIIREEKELEREIERNKMKMDIQQKRKIKQDIPVEIFMPKFQQQSKDNSVDKKKDITPERQIFKLKKSIEKLPTPKHSQKIIDQYIWKNNQDDANENNDYLKMQKELEDIIQNEIEQNSDSVIKEESEEINLSLEQKDLENMQLKNLEIEDQLNIDEIQIRQLTLENNFSQKKQNQIIDQLKFTLGELLSVEVFTKAYNFLKNKFKNEQERNKWILSCQEETFYNSIPFLKKFEFQQNYGLFAALIFMEETNS